MTTKTTKTDHLRALTRVCRQFGGRLAIVSQHEFDALFKSSDQDDHGLREAPFVDAHGLHWQKKVVFVVRDREKVGAIIHEMGHVFASPHHPFHSCHECHEWNWLGWEIALSRQIGATRQWSRHNANYVIDDGLQWDKLPTRQRRAVIAHRLALARKNGIVGTDDVPRSIR